MSREPTVHAAFLEAARRHPGRVAIRDAGYNITYGELATRVGDLATHLAGSGAAHGDRVGIMMRPSATRVTAVLAVLHVGATFVPIDPDLPDARRAFLATDAGTSVVVTSVDLADRVAAPAASLVPRSTRVRHGPPARAAYPATVDASTPAYLMYTSGTTGEPKGVMIGHRAVLNLVAAFKRLFRVAPTDGVLHAAPLSFDVAVWELFVPLLSGASCSIADREVLVEPDRLVHQMRADGVTIVDVAPHLLRELPPQGLEQLRVVMTGMEAFPSEVVEPWYAPHRRVFNGYGPTECTVISTVHECTAAWPGAPPIGHAINGMHASIVDPQRSDDRERDEGELRLAGVGVAQGYWRRDDLTSRVFGTDASGRPFYDTGDLVRRREDGALEFLGRVDDQVSIRGHRVEPAEIEHSLRSHPAVIDAAAIPIPDADGCDQLHAFVTVATAHRPTTDDLRAHLHSRVPGYSLPATVTVVDRWPLTSNGKVDKKALEPRRGAVDGAPGRGQCRSAREAELRRLWVAYLGGHDPMPTDNFVAAGGDSLIAMRIVARLRVTLRVPIRVEWLIRAPTYRDLVARIEEAPALAGSPSFGDSDDLPRVGADARVDDR